MADIVHSKQARSSQGIVWDHQHPPSADTHQRTSKHSPRSLSISGLLLWYIQRTLGPITTVPHQPRDHLNVSSSGVCLFGCCLQREAACQGHLAENLRHLPAHKCGNAIGSGFRTLSAISSSSDKDTASPPLTKAHEDNLLNLEHKGFERHRIGELNLIRTRNSQRLRVSHAEDSGESGD